MIGKGIKEQIDGLTEIIDHNEFMLSHKRCGYVYVVSNNDMKEGQYKIGITRRNSRRTHERTWVWCKP